jgi:hypothetical protein
MQVNTKKKLNLYTILNTFITKQHSLFAIPVTLCKYQFNNNDYQFHIFGTDKKVYVANNSHDSSICSIS